MKGDKLTLEPRRLGMVVGGSLTEGLEVKLEPSVSVEEMAVGRYISAQGQQRRFLGMITDVSLASTDPRLPSNPPDVSDPFIAQVVSGTSAFGILHVMPLLTIGVDGPQPVKTVPPHFSPVQEASESDIETVFGHEDQRHFTIGTPLDMETKVSLDLEKLVMRSNGVFGKSGTGKTFLTRLLLIGILQRRVASTLIFDMHGEYGWRGTSEGGGDVKGLKQLFPSQVAVFTLDQESAARRGITADFNVEIGFDEIEPEDIQMLQETLNLNEAQAQLAYRLERRLGGKAWLSTFLDIEGGEQLNELAVTLGEHESTVSALHRKLQILRRFNFLVPKAREDSVRRILEYLEQGKHVVLEFGRYGNELAAYILVANLISRRIHNKYVERMEIALGAGTEKPRPLVIVIEEAHRFLSPQVASQTIFGNIAREMRKYNVTLLVVDQRPSGIDEEVMSQMGTKLTCLLDNEKDVSAVLAGVSGRSALSGVLAKLESKQQALIFGHAVPMPIVIRVRDYGTPASYKELGAETGAPAEKQREQDIKDLWGRL